MFYFFLEIKLLKAKSIKPLQNYRTLYIFYINFFVFSKVNKLWQYFTEEFYVLLTKTAKTNS